MNQEHWETEPTRETSNYEQEPEAEPEPELQPEPEPQSRPEMKYNAVYVSGENPYEVGEQETETQPSGRSPPPDIPPQSPYEFEEDPYNQPADEPEDEPAPQAQGGSTAVALYDYQAGKVLASFLIFYFLK